MSIHLWCKEPYRCADGGPRGRAPPAPWLSAVHGLDQCYGAAVGASDAPIVVVARALTVADVQGPSNGVSSWHSRA